jgi:hypothetical protein
MYAQVKRSLFSSGFRGTHRISKLGRLRSGPGSKHPSSSLQMSARKGVILACSLRLSVALATLGRFRGLYIYKVGGLGYAAAIDRADNACEGEIAMRGMRVSLAALSAALLFLVASPAFSQGSEPNQGNGDAVVTVLPSHKDAAAPAISKSQLALKVNGKSADISKWEHLHGSNAPIQVVVLIDDSARGSLANQLGDIAHFVKSLPPSAEAAIAYMDNGRAEMAGPLSKDHEAVARELRVPHGPIGISGSPYFCLSDLAHHWPSHNTAARRVAVMITNGVDNYEVRYDPEDPYVQAAIHDAVRSRISVYSIFWRGQGLLGGGWYAANDGQNLLAQLTAATGGFSYWEGIGNPVSLQPYFKDLDRRLHNQYSLSFTVPLPNGPRVEALNLRASGTPVRLVAPQQVFVGHPANTAGGATSGD